MPQTDRTPKPLHQRRMNPSDRARRERDWADQRAGGGGEDGYEPTYRDGSVKHECWRDDQPSRPR